MNTNDAPNRHQHKTRSEMSGMSYAELDEERAALLQSISAIRGQLAAEKMLAECKTRQINDDWVIRAYTTAELMANTVRWITEKLDKLDDQRSTTGNAKRQKSKAEALAEIQLEIATQRRMNAEVALQMQAQAKAEKKIRGESKAAGLRALERIFVDVAKEVLNPAVFGQLLDEARARQSAQQDQGN